MSEPVELDLAIHSYSFVQHFQHAPGFGVFDFIRLAAERGFTGVNINLNRADWRHITGRSPEHLARVRRVLEELGLTLEIDTSGTDPLHLKVMLQVAQALGARNLRTYTRHAGTPQEVWARTLADLERAVDHAEATGVPLVLENHEEFTGPQLARLVETVGSPWLKVLYDYGNAQMLLEDPADCLEALLPHVLTMHLKDHLMLRPEHSPDGRLSVLGVAMGQGALPIVALTRRLLAAGHRRIVFESVWAYRAPVHRRADDVRPVTLGQGAFRYAEPPFDGVRLLPDAAALAASDPQALLAGELRAVDEGLAWLRAAFAAEGWRLRTR
jgi:sugar phosphate isomerase/epimerase